MSDDQKDFMQISSRLWKLQALFPLLYLLFCNSRYMICVHTAVQPLFWCVYNLMLGKLAQRMIEQCLEDILNLKIAGNHLTLPKK